MPCVPSAQVATTSSAVLAYRPCFVTESATGAQVQTQLIVVNPRGLSSTAAGVAVTPKLIEIQPTLIKVFCPTFAATALTQMHLLETSRCTMRAWLSCGMFGRSKQGPGVTLSVWCACR